MSDSAARERVIALVNAEASSPDQLNWLSFCDPEKPKGSQFLGVAIVRAPGFATACVVSHTLRCNPGGEIAGYELGTPRVPEEYINRLLTKEDVEKLEKIMESLK